MIYCGSDNGLKEIKQLRTEPMVNWSFLLPSIHKSFLWTCSYRLNHNYQELIYYLFTLHTNHSTKEAPKKLYSNLNTFKSCILIIIGSYLYLHYYVLLTIRRLFKKLATLLSILHSLLEHTSIFKNTTTITWTIKNPDVDRAQPLAFECSKIIFPKEHLNSKVLRCLLITS